MSKFKDWMAASSSAEKQDISVLADASIQHLYDIAAGRRKASADLAGRIEMAVKAVNKRKREVPLPAVRRGDICEACFECPYYREGCK